MQECWPSCTEDLRTRGIGLTVTNAHGRVRDLLRAERLDDKIQGIARGTLLETELHALSETAPQARRLNVGKLQAPVG